MSTTLEPDFGLLEPAVTDPNWGTTLNVNWSMLDASASLGGIAVRINEYPSASLNIHISGGSYIEESGAVGTFAATVVAVAASSTTYVYLDDSGALQQSTAGFPAFPIVPLATVVSGASTITSIVDSRIYLSRCGPGIGYLDEYGGTLIDGAALVLGTVSGAKFGTAANQKLGFYGATPVIQPSGSAQAAIGGITTAEPTFASVGATNASDVSGTINANFALIDTAVGQTIADLTALEVLVNAIRAALVQEGLMKGSA